ncbi:MAG TPA: TIGR02587 family membrane protein [Herpetosiphonaceae bacterium]
MSAAPAQTQSMWSRELDDLIRGVSGGFLFGIPLLYTMEVWWIGSFSGRRYMLVALITTFVVVLLLNRMAGFRHSKDVRWVDAAMDSVEAMAIGLVCTGLLLVLLREITAETPLREILGKVIFESVPFSLGVALANQFLYRPSDDNQGDQEGDPQERDTQTTDQETLRGTAADIGATLVGALIIAFNISPTEEIPMLAAAVAPPWLLLIMAASLVISYGIVFESNFADQQKRRQQQGIFQQPISETVASYLVSLLAAAFMLWFFQQLSFSDPWTMWLHHTLLLGLPATVGGAAGRLAI